MWISAGNTAQSDRDTLTQTRLPFRTNRPGLGNGTTAAGRSASAFGVKPLPGNIPSSTSPLHSAGGRVATGSCFCALFPVFRPCSRSWRSFARSSELEKELGDLSAYLYNSCQCHEHQSKIEIATNLSFAKIASIRVFGYALGRLYRRILGALWEAKYRGCGRHQLQAGTWM